MASEAQKTPVNGESSSSPSLAALLEKQHARDEAHQATVEDAVDDYDIQHPAPSSSVNDQKAEASSGPAAQEHTPPAPAAAPTVAPKKSPALDVNSEESFPALGSGLKQKSPGAAAPSTWGTNRPSVAAAAANGSQRRT